MNVEQEQEQEEGVPDKNQNHNDDDNKSWMYCRLSQAPNNNNQKAVSLETQRFEILKYCRENNLTLPINQQCIHEIHSAYKGRRSKFDQMIDNLVPGSILYVYSFDRFDRNVVHGLQTIDQLTKRNIKVISVTEPLNYLTKTGRHQLQTLLAAAELSSGIIGEKIKASNEYRKSLGSITGSVPYGFSTRKRIHTTVNCLNNNTDTNETTTIHTSVREKIKTTNEHEWNVVMFICAIRSGQSASVINHLLSKIIPKDKRHDPEWTVGLHFYGGYKCMNSLEKPDEHAITFSNIAQLLNEYQIVKHDKISEEGTEQNKNKNKNNEKWHGAHVQSIFSNHHLTCDYSTIVLEETKEDGDSIMPSANKKMKYSQQSSTSSSSSSSSSQPMPALPSLADIDDLQQQVASLKLIIERFKTAAANT
jgi:DNA invertase Pin-like site-specific DNA recombinase